MKNKFSKMCFSSVLSLAVMLPVMANTTTITINAEVGDFLVVQIERIAAADNGVNKIVSGDDFHRGSNAPLNDEVLNFGVLDSRGVSGGDLSSANNLLPDAQLQRVLLDMSGELHTVNKPPAHVAGALYYIKSGYQIRTVRSPGSGNDLTTDVDVYNDGSIKTFVNLSSENMVLGDSTDPGLTGTLASGSIRNADSAPDSNDPDGVSVFSTLKSDVENNQPFGIDIGLYVENSTPAGPHTTTITFTGT